MRINYNVSAMLANNKLANSDNLLAKSLERLSSGLKINAAKDNPAGLAIAKRMNSQLESLSVATQSAGDGVSIIETADGAMAEISDMLQRMNELAIKSANGPYSEKDREVIQDEVKQLTEEITRISETTEFNGQKLLNGEFSLKGYVNGNLGVKVSSYSREVTAKLYHIESFTIDLNPLYVNPYDTPDDGQGTDEDADSTDAQVETNRYIVEMKLPADTVEEVNGGFPQGATASIKDNLVTIQAVNGFEMVLDLSALLKDKDESDFPVTIPDPTDPDYVPLEIDATGIGAMVLQVGANEGQTLEIDIPQISLRNMGLDNLYVKDDKTGEEVWTLDVSTQNSAREAIDRIDGAIQYVSSVRGHLGAYENRLDSIINSLNVTSENMTSAYSRIMDVDMAEEMTNYTTYQVMTQAGISMLAQANERPAQVLQLLQ